MSVNNFIPLDRKIMSHWLWDDKPFSKGQAWIDLLMLANYTDKKRPEKGKIVTYKRGDVNLSMKHLADRWGWDRRTVKRFLDLLESDGMVSVDSTTHGTTITIVKYEDFNSPCTTKGTTNGTTDGTSNAHQNVQQMVHQMPTTNKVNKDNNENKDEESKKDISDSDESDPPPKPRRRPKDPKHQYGEYGHVLLTDKERDRLFNDYGEAQALEAIRYLDEYIQMKGYKAKDHNLAIRKWVFDALDRERQKQQRQGNSNGYRDNNGSIDWSKV